MKQAEWLQETRKIRFEEAYGGWQNGRLTQEEAARSLSVCERTFRRYIDHYEDGFFRVYILRPLVPITTDHSIKSSE